MKRYAVSLFLCAILVVSQLTACGGNAPEQPAQQTPEQSSGQGAQEESQSGEKKIVRWGYQMEAIGNLDVNLTNENNIYQLSDMMLDTLVMKNPETMEIEPSLSDMPEISADGKTYTFKLKEGIKFINGDELTSDDVEYTFYRIFAPEYQGLNTWFADMISGAQDLIDGNADTLSGFTKIDEYSFSIQLDYAFSAFPAVIASSPFGIVNKAECEKAGERWGLDTIVGTGPYKLIEFVPNSRLTMETNQDYFKGAPKIDGVEMLHMNDETAQMEFMAGNIDVFSLDNSQVAAYKNDPKLSEQMHYQQYMTTVYMMFNTSMEPLNDVRVRKAISLAIDANVVAQDYFSDSVTVAYTYIPKGMVGYSDNAEKINTNIEEAKRLLAEAGYPDGITITDSESNQSGYLEVLQILQEQLRQANITLNIEKMDAAAWMDQRKSGQLMAYCNGYTADYPDPDQFFYSIFRSDAAKNRSTGMEDPEVDKLIDEGRLITDPDEKQEHYASLDRFIVHDNVNLRPLYYFGSYLMVSDRVKGVFMKPDRLISFWDAEIE